MPLCVPQQRLQQQALVLRRHAPPGPLHPGLPEAGGCEPGGDGHEIQAGTVPALSGCIVACSAVLVLYVVWCGRV